MSMKRAMKKNKFFFFLMIIRAHSCDLFSLKANDFMYFTHSAIQNVYSFQLKHGKR